MQSFLQNSDTMPRDLQLCILDYLKLSDLNSVAQVSSYANKLAKSPTLVKKCTENAIAIFNHRCPRIIGYRWIECDNLTKWKMEKWPGIRLYSSKNLMMFQIS